MLSRAVNPAIFAGFFAIAFPTVFANTSGHNFTALFPCHCVYRHEAMKDSSFPGAPKKSICGDIRCASPSLACCTWFCHFSFASSLPHPLLARPQTRKRPLRQVLLPTRVRPPTLLTPLLRPLPPTRTEPIQSAILTALTCRHSSRG